MNEKYHISIYRRQLDSTSTRGLPSKQFEQFAALLPPHLECKEDGFYPSPLLATDPTIPLIIDALIKVGVDLFESTFFQRNQITFYKERQYTYPELEEFEYLQIFHADGLGKATSDRLHDAHNLPHIKLPITPLNRECGSVFSSVGGRFILVRGSVKKELDKSNLRGLRLIEPTLSSAKKIPEDERVWFIWSDLMLPKMKNLVIDHDRSIKRFDQKDRPIDSSIYQGFLLPGEIHYNRSNFEKGADFDVAQTFEAIGNRGTLERQLVYSHKFLNFCKKELGITFEGEPIRLVNSSEIPWEGPFPQHLSERNKRPSWLDTFA